MECTEHRNSLCRVCIKCDPKIRERGASIFDKTEDVFIYERLNTICDVDIKPEDGFPDRICLECLLELHNAVRFKNKCQNSNNVLLSTVNTNSESTVKEEAIEDVKLGEDHYTDHEFLDDGEDELEYEEPHSPPPDHIKHEHGQLHRDEGTDVERSRDLKLNDQLCFEEHEHKHDCDLFAPKPKTEKPSRAVDLKLECHDCGGIFKSKFKLKVHWKREHLRQLLTCDKCKLVFKTFKTLNDHKKKKSLSCNTTYKIFKIDGTGRFRKYYCKQCNYTTTKNVQAFRHTVKHTGDKRFFCNLCDKSYTQRSGLHYHMECHHKMYKKEANCTICGKFIQGLRMFNIHMRRHKYSKNTVTCEICHKTIKKRSLRCHMEIHLAKKAYTCDVCSKEFANKSCLCNHIKRMHERKADSMCPICSFKNFDSRVMNAHIARHTGDKLPCLVCGRFYKNEQLLASHMERHKSKNYKCPECDKVYLGKKFMVRHLKDVHKIH